MASAGISIKAGATAAWQWVSDKAKAASDWIVNAFLSWTRPGLNIKHRDDIMAFTGSLPARMMEIGRHIIDGLTDGAKAKWVATRPASASAAPTVNITVNTAPGSDGRAIGQTVTTEVERVLRAQAARQRARLSD